MGPGEGWLCAKLAVNGSVGTDVGWELDSRRGAGPRLVEPQLDCRHIWSGSCRRLERSRTDESRSPGRIGGRLDVLVLPVMEEEEDLMGIWGSSLNRS